MADNSPCPRFELHVLGRGDTGAGSPLTLQRVRIDDLEVTRNGGNQCGPGARSRPHPESGGR